MFNMSASELEQLLIFSETLSKSECCPPYHLNTPNNPKNKKRKLSKKKIKIKNKNKRASKSRKRNRRNKK